MLKTDLLREEQIAGQRKQHRTDIG